MTPANADDNAVEEAVAAYVAAGSFASLPARAIRVARLAIRDCLGVILAGLAEDSGRLVAQFAKDEAAAGDATVLGRGWRTSPANAAFVNATTAHALDFDDSHHPSMTHPTAVLLPALLAVGEEQGSSGAALLTAYLYALDAATAIAGAVNPDHYSAGWHPTATIGALAAALGAARLSGLDAQQTAHALRIAANRCSGTRAVFGSMGKAMNAGTAAQNGVIAAALARRGFTSGTGVLSGPAGFSSVHAGPERLRLSHALDGDFTIAVGGLSLKRYPSCGVTQAPIEAALRLAAAPANDIDHVLCIVEPYVRQVLIVDPPQTSHEARFNLEHCVAVALVDGSVGMAQLSDERVHDPTVRALAARVRVQDRPVAPGSAGPDMRWPCEIQVVRTDGTKTAAVVDEPAGRSFGDLLPEAELLAKFTDCVQWAGLSEAQAGALIAALDELEALSTLEPISAALRRRLPRVDTTLLP
jgi:2-methylcitrate dehydratase PrpD